MKKINYFASLALLLVLLGFLAGCNKDKEVGPSYEKDFAAAKSTMDVIAEIQSVNNMALTYSDPNGRRAASKETGCGTVTIVTDEAIGTATTTVDFGTGQTCADGSVRKGKIVFTMTSSSSTTVVNMNAQFIGYEVDSKKLEGEYTVSITYNEAEETSTYLYGFKNGILTYPDGSKVSWNSNYEMKMGFVMNGNFMTVNIEMTGGVSGTNREGKTFSADITSPLKIDSNCQYGLISGKYLLKAEGYADAVYDFGNGACDDFAILTINGKTEKIKITK